MGLLKLSSKSAVDQRVRQSEIVVGVKQPIQFARRKLFPHLWIFHQNISQVPPLLACLTAGLLNQALRSRPAHICLKCHGNGFGEDLAARSIEISCHLCDVEF